MPCILMESKPGQPKHIGAAFLRLPVALLFILLAGCSSPNTVVSGAKTPAQENTARRYSILDSGPAATGTGRCQTTRGRIVQVNNDVAVEVKRPEGCSFSALFLLVDGRSYPMTGASGLSKLPNGHWGWAGDKATLLFSVGRPLNQGEAKRAKILEPDCSVDCLSYAAAPTPARAPAAAQSQVPPLSCDEARRTGCAPERAKSTAQLMCAVAREGCDKVADRLSATSDKVLFRSQCQVELNNLEQRTEQTSKVLARYRYKTAAPDGANDVANKMMKEGGVSAAYGGMVKILATVMGTGIRAGQGGENCDEEYEAACRRAYEFGQRACR